MLATTDSPLDTLEFHQAIQGFGMEGKSAADVPAGCGDRCGVCGVQAEHREAGRRSTGENVGTYKGYLNALRNRRAFFKTMGATATDHGHLTAMTADLDAGAAESLYQRILSGKSDAAGASELFQAQMLTEMAGMSVEDGLTMQLHPGQRAEPQRSGV